MKSVSEKKSRGHRTSKIVKSKQSIAVAIYPIIAHLSTYPAHANVLNIPTQLECLLQKAHQMVRAQLFKGWITLSTG